MVVSATGLVAGSRLQAGVMGVDLLTNTFSKGASSALPLWSLDKFACKSAPVCV